MTFFRTKIAKIRSSFSVPSSSSVPTADLQSGVSRLLCCFPEITQLEVEDTIRGMGSSSCALDPFPTALVKANISAISSLITMIINQSLQSGHIPSALKTAIIRPLFKKPTFDPQTLANYRFWRKLLPDTFRTISNATTFLKSFSLVSVLLIARKQP